MDFGDKLQKLRKESNLTQEQLAEKLFVSRTAVSKWESGRGYPNLDSLQAIARTFSTTVDILLSNEEIMSLAKIDSSKSIKKIELRIFGILDLLSLLLIFIPLFGQNNGEKIISVSLLAWTGIPDWIRITYFVFILCLASWGLAEEFIQYHGSEKIMALSHVISFGLHSLLILFFIANLQPYGAAFSFCFLLAKIAILLKPITRKA